MFFITAVLSVSHGDVASADEKRDARKEPFQLELSDGFQYRWGDPDIAEGDLARWLYDDSADVKWAPYDLKNPPSNEDTHHFIWLRKLLPQTRYEQATLLIPPFGAYQAFEVYIDTLRIYRCGELQNSPHNRFYVRNWHSIPLPPGHEGKYMLFRFYSDNPKEIGLRSGLVLGTQSGFFRWLIRKEVDVVALGFLFVFIALFSIIIFLKRRQEKIYLLLSFGILALMVGLYHLAGSGLSQLFYNQPIFWWYVFFVSFFLFPVGMVSFFEQTIGSAYKSLIRALLLVHILFAGGALLLDLFNVVEMQAAFRPFLILLTLAAVVIIVTLIKAILVGNKEARLFGIGTIFLIGSGLHDILGSFDVIPFPKSLFHWGLFVFISFLAFILERRFSEAHHRLRAYSKELEEKSRDLQLSKEKLEEYNRTLEQRVEERTQTLKDKNVELETTLSELTQTQAQLVQSEKMAAVGNLAAGIVHEVKSPMGAVNSAVDVQARCITKLDEILKKSESIDDIKGNPQFEKLFRMLAENNQLTITAGQRISRIVKSLKNFTRLDEAELQKADIHEGLDSTLTLAHHELKNKAEVVKEYGDIPEISCYANQLNQVFMNLFVNAAHAMEEKGILKIKTYADDKNVHIEISDTGKGIGPEHIKKIFDPGFTTKERGKGTGLGLSISRNIIEKHRGKILVDSEVGKGSTFTVVLPIS